MPRPKVSVIFLCYNQERFVEAALRSALDQATWTPIQSPVTGTGADVTVEVPFGAAAGFIRVIVE